MTVIGRLRTGFPLLFLLVALTASAQDANVGTVVGEKLTPEGRLCSYANVGQSRAQLLYNGTVETRTSAVDHYILYPKTTRCPKTVEVYDYGYKTGKGVSDELFEPGQKIHICAYYLHDETIEHWHNRHPNAPDPLFEGVFPESTKCPDPPDDYTPLDPMTPAQHERAWRIVRENDCRSLRDRATSTAASEYQACLASRTPVGGSTASYMIKTLPEMNSSRHLVGGGHLSFDSGGGNCSTVDSGAAWSYMLSVSGKRGDQYFCVGKNSGVIRIGRNYNSDPPEPLESWRKTHAGLTLNDVLLDPHAVRSETPPVAATELRGTVPVVMRSSDELNAFMASNLRLFDSVYQAAAKRDPKLRGSVTLQFTIAPSGEISDCIFLKSDIQDASFERALVELVSTLHFEAKTVPSTRATAGLSFAPPPDSAADKTI